MHDETNHSGIIITVIILIAFSFLAGMKIDQKLISHKFKTSNYLTMNNKTIWCDVPRRK